MNSVEIFWSHVNKLKDSDCWEWTAGKQSNGLPYGKAYKNTKTILAHRFSWEIHFGNIPDKLFVLHKCDNPSCVNPNHLFLGTAKDNANDRDKKGRGATKAKNGNSKLSKDQIIEIRNLYKTKKHSQDFIARKFRVSQAQISKITRNIYWRYEE